MSEYKSIIDWISVLDSLPELNIEVMFVCKDGSVGIGMRSEMPIYERSKESGYFQKTDETQIEWGIEQNGGEYWDELTDVILWANIPESPVKN